MTWLTALEALRSIDDVPTNLDFASSMALAIDSGWTPYQWMRVMRPAVESARDFDRSMRRVEELMTEGRSDLARVAFTDLIEGTKLA